MKPSRSIGLVSLIALTTMDELLKRMAIRRHEALIAARGHGYFADVQIAMRVDANVVRREEVPGRTGIVATAPARQQFAGSVKHTQSRMRRIGGCRQPGKHSSVPADLDNENAILPIDEDLHGASHV